MNSHRAWIGLGSNLGDPRQHIEQALEELDGLPLTRRLNASRCYASRPLGPQDQPDFINAVALIETHLSPLALLDQLQALEQRHRRVRARHWGPRTLDLDLLLFDDSVLVLPRLSVPHPELIRRAFVAVPLLELAPEAALPDGSRLAALAETLDTSGLTALLPEA